MPLTIVPALIAHRSISWIKVALRSYHRQFPCERILVIDNNPDRDDPTWEPACEQERALLEGISWVALVKTTDPCKRHGAGIDLARQWCRQRGADVLLHFEPDCLVRGIEWRRRLLQAIEEGAWMAGSHRQPYGPIHPTPSAWRVDRFEASFLDQPRAADQLHPRFFELFDVKGLLEGVARDAPELVPWWAENWDTAQKNWFVAAVHDRAVLVDPSGDFCHFWCGSTGNRAYPGLRNDPELAALAAD